MQKLPLNGNRQSQRTLISVILVFLLMPATILFGVFCLGDRKYYFVSLLIILYAMVPFFLVFEKRRPQARELIVISVLAAIATAGRAAFFMLPQCKPVIAIVTVAGVCFGGESGFLVGAVTGFVSDFFFGQGPWTPWQMFAFGIIGFLAGILFRRGILKKSRTALCMFGGLSAFFLYGGIMDLSTVFTFTSEFSLGALLAAYATGLWFNLVHAAATVVFLFLLAEPMTEKLERIKLKYGMLEP
ncbi:hypothetical protein SDC9_65727 [bioreactor metagenome]|uniref:ECF transporter S component n=1 Tax=bioreactor metagenome TaxID=1076179 RepID=A0A644XZ50_9ZZZZ